MLFEVIFCNPCNPTGVLYTKESLEALRSVGSSARPGLEGLRGGAPLPGLLRARGLLRGALRLGVGARLGVLRPGSLVRLCSAVTGSDKL